MIIPAQQSKPRAAHRAFKWGVRGTLMLACAMAANSVFAQQKPIDTVKVEVKEWRAGENFGNSSLSRIVARLVAQELKAVPSLEMYRGEARGIMLELVRKTAALNNIGNPDRVMAGQAIYVSMEDVRQAAGLLGGLGGEKDECGGAGKVPQIADSVRNALGKNGAKVVFIDTVGMKGQEKAKKDSALPMVQVQQPIGQSQPAKQVQPIEHVVKAPDNASQPREEAYVAPPNRFERPGFPWGFAALIGSLAAAAIYAAVYAVNRLEEWIAKPGASAESKKMPKAEGSKAGLDPEIEAMLREEAREMIRKDWVGSANVMRNYVKSLESGEKSAIAPEWLFERLNRISFELGNREVEYLLYRYKKAGLGPLSDLDGAGQWCWKRVWNLKFAGLDKQVETIRESGNPEKEAILLLMEKKLQEFEAKARGSWDKPPAPAGPGKQEHAGNGRVHEATSREAPVEVNGNGTTGLLHDRFDSRRIPESRMQEFEDLIGAASELRSEAKRGEKQVVYGMVREEVLAKFNMRISDTTILNYARKLGQKPAGSKAQALEFAPENGLPLAA